MTRLIEKHRHTDLPPPYANSSKCPQVWVLAEAETSSLFLKPGFPQGWHGPHYSCHLEYSRVELDLKPEYSVTQWETQKHTLSRVQLIPAWGKKIPIPSVNILMG